MAGFEVHAESMRWRHHNLGRLLSLALQTFEHRVLELLNEQGLAQVLPSHINATRHLEASGTRLTELARRAGMTKQSMAELVAQLEKQGLVFRTLDPSDARARLIQFTPLGLTWLEAFRLAVEQAEAELAARLGAEVIDEMKVGLKHISSAAPSLGG